MMEFLGITERISGKFWKEFSGGIARKFLDNLNATEEQQTTGRWQEHDMEPIKR